jgi:uncharacterized protein YjiS (DUF1127 family)
MTPFGIHFVDPTIPGISGRDLVERAIESAQAAFSDAGSAFRAAHKNFALRRGLSGLDRHQLRDLGIDRDAS